MFPFLHPLSSLLFLSILVPKAVEEDIFNFSSGIVLSDGVQVGLGLVARDLLNVGDGESFYNCLESAGVLDGIEAVVERPADDRQDNCLNSNQRAKVNAVFHEANEGAVGAHQTVSGSEGPLAIRATSSTLEEAV